ncbi:hypothetical protein GQ42DRAFT_168273 [Ramicandelaber brevisporus]|nr:hypothetical protein GQ42DRAFT_168273 [Ramicandelaber brevisporus]
MPRYPAASASSSFGSSTGHNVHSYPRLSSVSGGSSGSSGSNSSSSNRMNALHITPSSGGGSIGSDRFGISPALDARRMLSVQPVIASSAASTPVPNRHSKTMSPLVGGVTSLRRIQPDEFDEVDFNDDDIGQIVNSTVPSGNGGSGDDAGLFDDDDAPKPSSRFNKSNADADDGASDAITRAQSAGATISGPIRPKPRMAFAGSSSFTASNGTAGGMSDVGEKKLSSLAPKMALKRLESIEVISNDAPSAKVTATAVKDDIPVSKKRKSTPTVISNDGSHSHTIIEEVDGDNDHGEGDNDDDSGDVTLDSMRDAVNEMRQGMQKAMAAYTKGIGWLAESQFKAMTDRCDELQASVDRIKQRQDEMADRLAGLMRGLQNLAGMAK